MVWRIQGSCGDAYSDLRAVDCQQSSSAATYRGGALVERRWCVNYAGVLQNRGTWATSTCTSIAPDIATNSLQSMSINGRGAWQAILTTSTRVIEDSHRRPPARPGFGNCGAACESLAIWGVGANALIDTEKLGRRLREIRDRRQQVHLRTEWLKWFGKQVRQCYTLSVSAPYRNTNNVNCVNPSGQDGASRGRTTGFVKCQLCKP